jgi:hypothetical protein
MDKKEFHRISDVIEGCIEDMNEMRVEAMLRMFESIAKAYADKDHGMILLELLDDGVLLSSVNVDEVIAAELIGAMAIKMQRDIMYGAPPKEMFN